MNLGSRFEDDATWSKSNNELLPGTTYLSTHSIHAHPDKIKMGDLVLFKQATYLATDKFAGHTVLHFSKSGIDLTVKAANNASMMKVALPEEKGFSPENWQLIQQLHTSSPASRAEAIQRLAANSVAEVVQLFWPIALYDHRPISDRLNKVETVAAAAKEALVTLADATILFLTSIKARFGANELLVARSIAASCQSDLFWDEILKDCSSESVIYRKRAVRLLASYATKEAKELLGKLSEDSSSDVRLAASSALGRK